MADLFHVVLPTDVFPPNSGGAGWSTLALARALQARDHQVTVVVPRRGWEGLRRNTVQDVPVLEVGYTAPRVPFVQNYYRFELLWPLLRNVLVSEVLRQQPQPVILHAQHAQTAPAAVLAAREVQVPVLATVRDAWPWHYFATGLLGDRVPFQQCSAGAAWLDLIGRLGPLKGTLAVPAIPYVLRHVERRAQLLAEADAVIAVSRYMRRKLEGLVPDDRLHVIPNLIDLELTWQTANQPSLIAPAEPFVLFVGKLERNKGAQLLPEALAAARAAGTEPPLLVIAGAGALEAEIRQQLTAQGLRHRFLPGWTDHDEVLRLMLRAEVLLYPSAWGEPLSRVLLEASAVGACIAAFNTGGTADIVEHDVSGLLVGDAVELGRALAHLLSHPAQQIALRAGARSQAAARFGAEVVTARVTALYRELHQQRRDTRC